MNLFYNKEAVGDVAFLQVEPASGEFNYEYKGDVVEIKNESQVKVWWKWYRNGETHRFNQQVGKQYSYGKGNEELSTVEMLKIELKRKEVENEILKKYKELERKWSQR
mgnify:CR=1 FL=1